MLKILVVDDDRNMRELLSLHLKHAGYEVHVAEDGIAAGYAVLYQQPDLIICDVFMPHMNGFEFVAALRADPVQQNIPVIFLTTAVESEAREESWARSATSASPYAPTRCFRSSPRRSRAGWFPCAEGPPEVSFPLRNAAFLISASWRVRRVRYSLPPFPARRYRAGLAQGQR